MPREWTKPEVFVAQEVISVYKRELHVRWENENEENKGIIFVIERSDGERRTFKASGALLDMPLSQLNGASLRQHFDAIGDALLSINPEDIGL